MSIRGDLRSRNDAAGPLAHSPPTPAPRRGKVAAYGSDGASSDHRRAASARGSRSRSHGPETLLAKPSGRAAAAELSDVFDGIVTELWHTALSAAGAADDRDLALVATGGWGRREMSPYSDIDFILLTASEGRGDHGDDHDEDSLARRVSDQLLYPLWDAGIKVVPSMDHPLSRARLAPHRSAHRHRTSSTLATSPANRELSDALSRAARRHLAPGGNANKFLDRLTSHNQRRRDKFGDSLYLLEPDLKNGIGALRDLYTAIWSVKARWSVSDLRETVTMGLVSARQVAVLREALDFLLALRSLVQLRAKRATDRLTFEIQEAIAPELYPDATLPMSDIRPAVAPAVETLMQRFYVHARAVVQVTDRMLELTRVPARRKPRIYRIDSSFLSWGGKLALRDPHLFHNQPSEMLRLFRVALDRDLPIYGHTKELIAEGARQTGDSRRHHRRSHVLAPVPRPL